MTVRLNPNRSLGRCAKRIVRAEIDDCLRDLVRVAENFDELNGSVHDIRKRCKKIRAMLRLLRKVMGDGSYRCENLDFREVARPLRYVRDADSLVESLDKLTERANGVLPLRACADLREELVQRKDAARDQMREPVPVCDQVGHQLREARVRLRDWKFKKLNWPQLRDRLQHEFEAGALAFRVATEQQTPEQLHEWRKQVKYLFNQLQILKPVWRGAKKTLGRDLEELADILGDDHDLAELKKTVAAESAKRGLDADLEDLALTIEEQRQELEQQAFAIGERVFGQSKKVFRRQINRWWKSGR